MRLRFVALAIALVTLFPDQIVSFAQEIGHTVVTVAEKALKAVG